MRTLTKQNIEQLAKEIMAFLERNEMQDCVSIYINNKRIHSEYKFDGENITYFWKEESNIDPHDYFEYAAYDHILSMGFEGELYEVLNETFGTMEEQFREIFDKYGLYFEFGNSWNLTAYPNDDNMKIEYTKYKKPKETIRLYRNCDMPIQLKNIMDMWYELSKNTGDIGSCVLGAGFKFEWNGDEYFMSAQSPWQGSISWEKHIDVVKQALENIGATEIYYNWGRID